MTYNVTIAAENKQGIIDRLATLNKRAAKIGIDAISASFSTPYYLERGDGVAVQVCDVTIDAPALYLSGYELSARIDWLESGPIVTKIGGSDLPAGWAMRHGPACEHCGTKRQRSVTYVLRHITTGALYQVGGTCLDDFAGMRSAEAQAVLLCDLLTTVTEEGERLSGASPAYLLTTVLRHAAASIRMHGYTSKRTAREDYTRLATADDTMARINKQHETTESDATIAAQALAYMTSVEASSQYEENLQMLAAAQWVHPRHFGYVASAIVAAQRASVQQAMAAESQHIGAVGDKIGISVECIGIYCMDGAYGVTNIHTFRDSAGNVLVWRTGAVRIEKGATGTLTGKIKAHGEYRGVAQTELTRCKWSEHGGNNS